MRDSYVCLTGGTVGAQTCRDLPIHSDIPSSMFGALCEPGLPNVPYPLADSTHGSGIPFAGDSVPSQRAYAQRT